MDSNSQSEFNRRRLLQTLGATAVGAPAVGMASGKDSGVEIQESSGSEAENAVNSALNTEAFWELRVEMWFDGYAIDKDDPSVYYRESPDGTPHHVVAFPVNGETGAIAITLRDGDFDSARASVKEKNGRYVTTEWYDFDGQVNKDSVRVDIEDMTVEKPADVSISAVTACKACEAVGDIACSVGCGAGTSVLCALAGIGSVAGALACGAVASGFCAALTTANEMVTGHACQSDKGIELACEIAGYCD